MRVYVAGPYSADPVGDTARAIEAGNALLDAGHEPFVPHLAHYWDRLHTQRGYEDWMRLDLAWLRAAEVVLRLPGVSAGADRECALACELGIPVVHEVSEVHSA